MAVTARSIITSNEFKDYMGIAHDNFEQEAFVEQVIDLCSGTIEEAIDSCVVKQSTTEYVDGTGNTKLILANYIDSLVGATEAARLANLQYESADDVWTDIIDDENDLNFTGRTIEIIPTATFSGTIWGFPSGAKNIKVVYYAGFDPVPAKLKKVCLEMCAMMWKESNQGDGRLGLGSASGSGTGNLQYKDMQERWDAVLSEYVENTPNVSVINL